MYRFRQLFHRRISGVENDHRETVSRLIEVRIQSGVTHKSFSHREDITGLVIGSDRDCSTTVVDEGRNGPVCDGITLLSAVTHENRVRGCFQKKWSLSIKDTHGKALLKAVTRKVHCGRCNGRHPLGEDRS